MILYISIKNRNRDDILPPSNFARTQGQSLVGFADDLNVIVNNLSILAANWANNGENELAKVATILMAKYSSALVACSAEIYSYRRSLNLSMGIETNFDELLKNINQISSIADSLSSDFTQGGVSINSFTRVYEETKSNLSWITEKTKLTDDNLLSEDVYQVLAGIMSYIQEEVSKTQRAR